MVLAHDPEGSLLHEALGDTLRRDSELGHRSVLPEAAFAERPDQRQASARAPVGRDEPAFVVGVEPEPELVGPDQAVPAKRGDERVAHAREVGVRPRAVDHLADPEGLARRRSAPPDRGDDASIALVERLETPGHELEPARLDQLLDRVGRLGGRAVAMGLPVRPGVAQEPPALLRVEPLPERGRVRTNRRHDLAPVDVLPAALSHLAPQTAEQPDGGCRPCVERRGPIEMRRRLRGEAVRLGQEPATRDRVDAPLLVGVAERKRCVAHRQPGADEKHVVAAVELERVARPRVARVTDAREHRAVADRRVGRRVVPDREDDTFGREAPPVRQPEDQVVSGLRDGDHLACDPQQRQRRRAPGVVERLREVLAVLPARNERPAGQRRLAAADEAEEAVGVVLERAHAARGDVERVTRRLRPVRDAADASLDALDEVQAVEPGRGGAQQVDRDHGPAEPRTDDRDRAPAHVDLRLDARRTMRDSEAIVDVTCGVCGQPNEAGRKFCGECGSPLALACSACGAANAPGTKFCGECGSPLGDADVSAARSAPPASVAERRLVSVLFADLVGFTRHPRHATLRTRASS